MIGQERLQGETTYTDIEGTIISVGDLVAYGEWGSTISVGHVWRIAGSFIDIKSRNKSWERRVYTYNSDRMIKVIKND